MANKPITPEEMKAYVDATWEKCQTEAWKGLSPFDKTLLRTTHAPLKPVYYDRVNDHSVCAEVVIDWDKFFTEIESKLREKNYV
jgi:hypothetical protein